MDVPSALKESKCSRRMSFFIVPQIVLMWFKGSLSVIRSLLILTIYSMSLVACDFSSNGNNQHATNDTSEQIHSDLRNVAVTASNNAAQNNEIIVATGTGDYPLGRIQWCGSDAIVYDFGNDEVYEDEPQSTTNKYNAYRFSINTQKTIRLDMGPDEYLIQCTPDGKWALFSRGLYTEHGLWLYTLRSGKKRQLLNATDFPPAGQPFIFRIRRNETNKAFPWHVDAIPYLRQYSPNGFEAVWFSDTEQLLVKHQSDAKAVTSPYSMTVETHGNEKSFYSEVKGDKALSRIMIDKSNRIYGYETEFVPNVTNIREIKRKLVSCRLKRNQLDCDEIFPAKRRIFPFDISHDGNFLAYWEQGKPCIWVMRTSTRESRCVKKTRPTMFNLSPDGRRLLYRRRLEDAKKHRTGKIEHIYAVIELTNF